MKYELKNDYIELFKLLKLQGLVNSGAEAKYLVSEGYVSRNGEQEFRKRAKIIAGDLIKIADVTIEVL